MQEETKTESTYFDISAASQCISQILIAAVEAENETCAQIAESHSMGIGEVIATLIRKRFSELEAQIVAVSKA